MKNVNVSDMTKKKLAGIARQIAADAISAIGSGKQIRLAYTIAQWAKNSGIDPKYLPWLTAMVNTYIIETISKKNPAATFDVAKIEEVMKFYNAGKMAEAVAGMVEDPEIPIEYRMSNIGEFYGLKKVAEELRSDENRAIKIASIDKIAEEWGEAKRRFDRARISYENKVSKIASTYRVSRADVKALFYKLNKEAMEILDPDAELGDARKLIGIDYDTIDSMEKIADYAVSAYMDMMSAQKAMEKLAFGPAMDAIFAAMSLKQDMSEAEEGAKKLSYLLFSSRKARRRLGFPPGLGEKHDKNVF